MNLVGMVMCVLAVAPATPGKEVKQPPKAERSSPWPEGHPLRELYPAEEGPRAVAPLRSSGFNPAFVPTGVGNGLAWIQQLGTGATEIAQGAAATAQAVYVAGYSDGSFDGNTHAGANDFIVAKLLPSGAKVWTRQYGTPTQDYATAVATYSVSSPHSVYVAGYSAGSMDGSPKVGTAFDGVLIKLDENGTKLWTRQLNSPTNAIEQIFAVATDKLGNVYVAGNTTGSLGGTANQGGTDMFLAKYDSTGVLKWIRMAGTAKNDFARGVAADFEGNIYMAGHSFGALGGPNADPSLLTSDMVLLKYDTSGTLLWKKQMGNNKSDSVSGVVTSRQINGTIDVYVAGYTFASFDSQLHKGGVDVFMVKFDKLGNKQWSRQRGTPGNDYPNGMASDGGANLYVVGRTDHDMDTDTPETSRNLFLLKYNSTGAWMFTKQLGSVNLSNPLMVDDEGLAVAADIRDSVYVAGFTLGEFTNPVTANGGNDKADLLVAKYTVGCQDSLSASQCSIGYGWGDPHLVTFDRAVYDFQGRGDFFLTESLSGEPLTVQARMQPYNGSQYVTVMNAVATQVGTDRVGFYQGSNPLVRVNGTPVPLAVGELVPLPSGGRIYRQDELTYVVYYRGEDRMLVSDMWGSYMNVNFSLPVTRRGQLRGLLGNFNGTATDDFALRDGTSLGSWPSFSQLYASTGSMASSWRVPAAESLFDVPWVARAAELEGEDFPLMPVSSSSFPPDERRAAEAICLDKGVRDAQVLDLCTLDVAATGDASFADGALQAQAQEAGSGGGPLPPPQAGPRTVYFAHFNESVGAEWEPASQSITPSGEKIFLGEYGEQEVKVQLSELPEHTTVTVSFDLLILQGWDGDGPYGPNAWGFLADGSPVFESTFSNTRSAQSYPKKGSAPGSGAAARDSLGYPNGDSLYRMKFTFKHQGSALDLMFYAKGLSGLTGEAWGLDGVQVEVK